MMTEDKANNQGPAEPEEEIDEESDEGVVEPEIEQIEDDLEKARKEASDYLDSLQRLKAEFDNFRKRMLREQSEFLKLAAQEMIVNLLPVVDNFERALAHEIHADQVDVYKNGLQLVYSQLVDMLAKEGLTPLEPVGEEFDPTKHEAMMQVETDEHADGTVAQVVEKGYVLKDRVIRPARVVVAKAKS